MRIEVILDPQAEGYGELVRDLRHELAALPEAEFKIEETPAPKDTLDVEHDITRFIFEHGEASFKFLIVLLQILRAILERRNQAGGGIAVKAGEKTLKYPTTAKAEKSFVERVRAKSKKRRKSKAAKIKKGTKRRKGR